MSGQARLLILVAVLAVAAGYKFLYQPQYEGSGELFDSIPIVVPDPEVWIESRRGPGIPPDPEDTHGVPASAWLPAKSPWIDAVKTRGCSGYCTPSRGPFGSARAKRSQRIRPRRAIAAWAPRRGRAAERRSVRRGVRSRHSLSRHLSFDLPAGRRAGNRRSAGASQVLSLHVEHDRADQWTIRAELLNVLGSVQRSRSREFSFSDTSPPSQMDTSWLVRS